MLKKIEPTLEPFRILIVDDDIYELEAICSALAPEPYQLMTAASAQTALELVATHRPELVLCDVYLPDASGLDVCRRIKQEYPQTLIIFISGSTAETDKVLALEMGGEDYITKPLRLRELRSRIRVVLRHLLKPPLPETQTPPVGLCFGSLRIDVEGCQAYISEQLLPLTRKEFELLLMFAQQPGKVFNRQHILNQIWAHDMNIGDRIVDNHISNLRQKIESCGEAPYFIETVRGFGYRFRYPLA
jgi:DNA-binding response OmpR family regulator